MTYLKIIFNVITKYIKPILFVVLALVVAIFVYQEHKKTSTIREQKQLIEKLEGSLKTEKQAKDILAARLVKEQQLNQNLQTTLTKHQDEIIRLQQLQVENTKAINDILSKNEIWANQSLPSDLKLKLK